MATSGFIRICLPVVPLVALVVSAGLSCGSGTKLTDDERRGKQMYEGLCDKCHRLIPPKNLTDEQWIAAVDRYGAKLKLRDDEQRLLKMYMTRANDSDF